VGGEIPEEAASIKCVSLECVLFRPRGALRGIESPAKARQARACALRGAGGGGLTKNAKKAGYRARARVA